jgi:DNA repair exonuclease SbcCD nuclease subunit
MSKPLKKPRIWMLSDTHLGARNNSVEWLDRMTEYFDNFFIPLVKEHYQEGDILIHSGDVFDNRQSLNLLVMNRGLRIFEELSEIFKNGIHIIAGNHDILRKNTNDIASIDVLKYIPNISIYKEPEVLTINEHKILLMPWRMDHEAEVECIKEHSHCDYAFCHANITTMSFDGRRAIEHGSDINAYKQMKHVYSGHIHYGQSKQNVTFVGNPYQMTRSDAGNVKGIYCLDLDSGEHTFYENTYSPKFVRFYLDKSLDITLGRIRQICENNFVDIYVKSEYLIKYPINDLISELSEGARKLEIIAYEDEDLLDIDVEYDKSLNIYNLCEKYIDQMSTIEDKTKEKMKNHLFKLHQQVIKQEETT